MLVICIGTDMSAVCLCWHIPFQCKCLFWGKGKKDIIPTNKKKLKKTQFQHFSTACQLQCDLTFFFSVRKKQMWCAFVILKKTIRCSKVQMAFQTQERRSSPTYSMLRALLNQTAWKWATLSFQMMLIYHVGLCRCCSYRVLVYGSVDTAAQCLLTLHNPEGCPVLCLKHSSRFLFAGLQNGTMMVYGRNNSGKVLLKLLCSIDWLAIV